MRRLHFTRRGQSMVESALVLMTLIAVVSAILDFGQVLFLHQGLVNRTRAAARYGAVHWTDLNAVRNIVLYNSPAAPDPAPAKGFLGLTSSNVVVTRQNIDSNEERIVVRIQNYPFRFFTPWLSGLYRGREIVATAPVEI